MCCCTLKTSLVFLNVNCAPSYTHLVSLANCSSTLRLSQWLSCFSILNEHETTNIFSFYFFVCNFDITFLHGGGGGQDTNKPWHAYERSEENLQELVLSFYPAGPSHQTQVPKLYGNLPSH